MAFVNSNGVRVHYEVEGSGPPLVIQHGFTDSSATWIELGYVDGLRSDYRVILIDARGHGDSDKPHDPEAYDVRFNASDIVAVLDALAIPSAVFFGYSTGALTGFALAKHAPTRFSSMVLGGSPPLKIIPQPTDPMMEGLRKGAQAIADLWDAPVSLSLRARIEASDVEALIAMRKKRNSQLQDPSALDDVPPTMAMPCLVFAGEKDGYYPSIVENVARMPNTEFVSFPELTHAGLLFASDLVLPVLRKFLASHAAT
ncbi:MAG: pimeloyl-ACP methyl ester carboxylesterase [Gammaproteobacteria bacterium]|jgi:pimeloyl-ACP methyl ester carboxylesterase